MIVKAIPASTIVRTAARARGVNHVCQPQACIMHQRICAWEFYKGRD